MATTINVLPVSDYEKTKDLCDAVSQQFSQGAGMVHLTQDSLIIGTILSPLLTKEMLAQRVAERWLADPSFLDSLDERLNETPESW